MSKQLFKIVPLGNLPTYPADKKAIWGDTQKRSIALVYYTPIKTLFCIPVANVDTPEKALFYIELISSRKVFTREHIHDFLSLLKEIGVWGAEKK